MHIKVIYKLKDMNILSQLMSPYLPISTSLSNIRLMILALATSYIAVRIKPNNEPESSV